MMDTGCRRIKKQKDVGLDYKSKSLSLYNRFSFASLLFLMTSAYYKFCTLNLKNLLISKNQKGNLLLISSLQTTIV